jgi:multidrug efflux system outer membrane protein
MKHTNKFKYIGILICMISILSACSIPFSITKNSVKNTPNSFPNQKTDTINSAIVPWKMFFKDQNLIALIDTALHNNQELNIIMQEINISNAEIKARKGEYLPFMNLNGNIGTEKTPRYTKDGAVESSTNITPGKKIPDPLQNYLMASNATWEVDIWKKLRNAKEASVKRYLGTIEGKNFMVTNLVSEISKAYYELMALDNKLDIIKQYIEIQKNALEIVKYQKEAAKVTELAVRKFEAEVAKNQAQVFYIQQQIIEMENYINYLTGRFPQTIARSSQTFQKIVPDTIYNGIPSQLLANRPDIRKAEFNVMAAKLDVKSAKANFYPSLRISAGLGYQAFNPKYLLTSPESVLFNTLGDIVAPVLNRNAIKAKYYTATAKQIQTLFEYEKTIINAYVEVLNSVNYTQNIKNSIEFKQKQVEALNQSINVLTSLFTSARADYMEVLMTQRDALEAKIELIETKQEQLHNWVNLYQALGGGWR